MKLGDGAKYFSYMSVFLLRDFLHSDVLQERNYRIAKELNVRLFYRWISKCLLMMMQIVTINFCKSEAPIE